MFTSKEWSQLNTAVRPSFWRWMLHALAAFVTRTNRQVIEIEWSDVSLVHNAFRVFEYLFGRKEGIRAEALSCLERDEYGRKIITREFYTVEALLAFAEGELRASYARRKRSWQDFWSFEWVPIRIYVPQLAGSPFGTPQYLFAIAHNATSNGSDYSASSGETLSHTTAGSSRALVVSWAAGGADPSSSFTSQASTYNGTSMTKQYTVNAGNRQSDQFTLGNPASGANNVAATWSGGGTEIKLYASSYTGVDQSTPCEAQNSTSISSGTSASINVTTLTNNGMLVATIFVREGGIGDITSNGTIRSQDQTSGVADRAAATAGSNNHTFTIASGAAGSGTTFGAVALKNGATNVTVTPSALALTFSVPAYTVKTGRTITASVLAATFSLPSRVVSLPKTVLASVLSAVFSIPAYSAGGQKIVTASVVSATFSVPTYAVSVVRNIIVTVNALVATFSTPSRSIGQGTGVTVLASALTGTFSVPTYTVTVERNITVVAGVLSLTFSVPTLRKVGTIWTRRARSTDADWTRVARNSD